MKRLIVVFAAGLFAWLPNTALAIAPQRGPYIKNLMSPTYRAPAVATEKELTKKDIKHLTATAETRAEHLKFAHFWAAEANRLEAQAVGYEKAAATFRSGPFVKNMAAPSAAASWEFFAKGLRDEAKADRARAASHEQMAREA